MTKFCFGYPERSRRISTPQKVWVREDIGTVLSSCDKRTTRQQHRPLVFLGLKENVIIGKLIPAGTGMKEYQNIEVVTPIVQIDITENQ